MNLSKQSNLVLIVVLCAVIGVMASISRGSSATEAQDPSSLDRRISLLEQRFYSVESSISRLQQYVASQRTPVSQPSTNDRELSLIREEIQRLNLRMAEIECGVIKLDERTTPAARRSKPFPRLSWPQPPRPIGRLMAHPSWRCSSGHCWRPGVATELRPGKKQRGNGAGGSRHGAPKLIP